MKKFLVLGFFATSLGAGVEPKILFEQDPTLLTTTVQVVVRMGGVDDPEGRAGLANLLGDLILRGTKKKSRAVFQSEIEKMGASISSQALTDNTVFVGEVIQENTEKFLKLLHEALTEPALSKKEFDNIKREILAEIQHSKNANSRLAGVALRSELFKGTPMQRPVSGSMKTVSKITHNDVLEAYKRMYTQATVLFGVVSPSKPEEVNKTLKELWSKLPKGEAKVRTSIAPQLPSEPKIIVVHKPKTSTGSMVLGQAGITIQDPRRYALSVGNFSFGGEPLVSRLFRTVRGQLGYTYFINSSYGALGPLSNQQGLYLISTTPTVEFTTKTLTKTMSMWADYLKNGLDGEELTLAQESLVNSYPFEFDSAKKRLRKQMQSELYGIPVLSPEQYKKTIFDIDNGEIKKALSETTTENNWVISLVADADEFAKQLEAEQKDVPAAKRLKIFKRLTPDEVIQ